MGAGRDGDRRAPDRFLLSGGWSEGRSARWFSRAVRKALDETRKVLAESDGLLTRNRIFVDRMSGVGKISAEDAISHGITGPFLRAAESTTTCARIVPIPSTIDSSSTCRLGTNGDNLDRFLVRMEEMRQSIRIIEQALRDIPPGPVLTDPETGRSIAAAAMVDQAKAGEITAIADAHAVTDPTLDGSARPLQASIAAGEKRVLLPAKEDTYGNIEGLMRHFKLVMHGHGVRPHRGRYFPVEGRMESSDSMSSAMGPTHRTVCASVHRAFSSCRLCPSFSLGT